VTRYKILTAGLAFCAACYTAGAPAPGPDASPAGDGGVTPSGDAAHSCLAPSGEYVATFPHAEGCPELPEEALYAGDGAHCLDGFAGEPVCEVMRERVCEDGRSWRGNWKLLGDGTVLATLYYCVGTECCARTIRLDRAAE